ncbi:MAG: leucine-rich repeat protein [Methanobrevibacter sp.]|nr:leucine-rich repeat protein [Methanobrevibacter sp.]
MNNEYQKWLSGDDCCCGGFIHIEPCPSHKDVCDCDNILLEISKLHTDDEVLQEQIDELSGCCSGGSGGCECDLSDYYTIEEVDDIADDIREEIPVIPTVVSAFINDAGYLTEHQPLSGYVTNAEFIQVTSNLQQQIDSLRSAISGCCGQTGETYTRWITMTGASDYWCSGTTKMSEEKEQTSTDNINWTDTGNIRNGNTILEPNCEDCGYVPPTPPVSTDKAFVFNRYSGDTPTSIKIRNNCNGHSDIIVGNRGASNVEVIRPCSTILDISDIQGYGSEMAYYSTGTSSVIQDGAFSGTDLTQFNVYSGCTAIGKHAVSDNPKLTYVGIPGNANYISSAVTMPTIVDGTIQQSIIRHTPDSTYVSFIDDYAFANNPLLEKVVFWPCLQVPTIGTGVFSNCPSLRSIYVPSNLLNAFKTAPGWSAYASLIQAWD